MSEQENHPICDFCRALNAIGI